MGLVFWLYDRPLEPTLRYIDEKFGKKPEIAQANTAALKAGYHYGETVEAINDAVPGQAARSSRPASTAASSATRRWRTAWSRRASRAASGCSWARIRSRRQRHSGRALAHKNFDVLTFQAEDEIAAMTRAIGAAFAGAMAGHRQQRARHRAQGRGIGLAVMTELPMIVINVQRGGPSTGLPTKTEQADLLQALFGRNGECPMPVIAAASPADCFDVAQEAWRMAVRVHDARDAAHRRLHRQRLRAVADSEVRRPAEDRSPPPPPTRRTTKATFLPYQRDERLARPWAMPGTPGLEHRIGGLEKQDITGNVSYDPANHQHMVEHAGRKVANIANDIPPQKLDGPATRRLAGAELGRHVRRLSPRPCTTLQAKGKSVTHCHLRYLNPLPQGTGRHPEAVQEGARFPS